MKKKILLIIILSLACLSFIMFLLFSNRKIFKLNGLETVYLLLNGNYQDEGVEANYQGNDYHHKIKVTNNLDSSKIGEYQISYEFNEINKTLVRKIMVSDFNEFFSIQKEDDNHIKVIYDMDKISQYSILDLEKDNDDIYEVEKNKTYQFTIYDKYNNKLVKNIKMDSKILGFNELEMHFIGHKYYDDSILIRDNLNTIFIDGGRIETTEENLKYLNDLGISKIDYMIGSHVEYDHIEVQSVILDNVEVSNIIYPVDAYTCLKSCQCQRERDTKLLLKALDKHQIKPIKQDIPSVLKIGEITLYFLAPLKLTCNDNNNSFIFILEFKINKFMFTGDSYSSMHNIEGLRENAKKIGLQDINVDLLKFPHHGNDPMFDKTLKAINPKIIMVPNNHFPNFPVKSTIDRINKLGIEMYRQSDSKTGNILLTSDGTDITIKMDN